MKNYIKPAILFLLTIISFNISGCSCTGITPTFTVTYDGNSSTGGSVPVDPTVYQTDNIVTVLGNTGNLVNTGSFKGWNSAADGSGTSYTQGETFIISTESVILYAMWHSSVYALRDRGPAGGWIFYDKGSYSDGWQFMEAASESSEWSLKEWGSPENLINGTETETGTGQNNTTIIIEALSSGTETGRAAQLCNDLVTGGYSKWFLPSIDELDLIYTNLKAVSAGDFSDGEYWSSSEDNYIQVWSLNFSDGTKNLSSKTNTLRVRAVRAF